MTHISELKAPEEMPLDGRFSFSVVGNQNHTVRVYDGQFNYIKTMYFEKGVQKIINVEPGTAVYY